MPAQPRPRVALLAVLEIPTSVFHGLRTTGVTPAAYRRTFEPVVAGA
jgi:hypothetical protein